MGENEAIVENASNIKRDNHCSSCGCPLDWSKRYRGEDGFYYIRCPACRNVMATEEPAFSREAMQYYHEGKLYFRKQNFEDAITSFDEAIKLCSTYYEAYWLRLLAENGIEYVEDITGRPKPTCHRCSEKSLLEQDDFLTAVKLSPKEIAASYSQSAAEIDEIRKHVLDLARKGEEFDVFISFKKSDIDANGNEIFEVDSEGNQLGNRRTEDCLLAERIYSHLKEKGLKVFYSEVSLLDAVGANFEATIFRALDTSKVFILIGTKAEYVNATWVKNEWKRYLRMMSNGDKSPESFVYVYENKIPQKLDRNVLAGNRQALRYDAMFFASLDKVIERERARNLAPLERRTITGKMEALQEVAASLQYQNREFVADANFYVEVDDERKIETVKKNLQARNFSGAEFMLNGLLKKMPGNPRLLLLSALAENGLADEDEFVDKALAAPEYVELLDGIIAYCGKDDPTLATILGMVTKIFLQAGANNPDSLRRAFEIICQCSNVSYVQKGLGQYIKYMYSVASKLLREDVKGKAQGVFDDLLRSIGLVDSLDETSKSLVYAAFNADFAGQWHERKCFDVASTYYAAAIEYNPNVAEYYFSNWLCKVKMRNNAADFIASANIIIPDFDLSDVEMVLVHSTDSAEDTLDKLNSAINGFGLKAKLLDRNGYAKKFVDIATEQVKQHNVQPAIKLFEYIVSTIPRSDVKVNEGLLMPFSDGLLREGFFQEAGKYLREMLAISHNQCSKAFFDLILVDLECRNVDELIQCDKVVQLQEMPDFMSAIGCGTVEEAEEYLAISDKKLEFYEKSRVKKGFALLGESKFDEAKKVFNDLLNFEKNTRKRDHTFYPDVYWGLLLAETQCASKEELCTVEKQIAFPNAWIAENVNVKNYLDVSAKLKLAPNDKRNLDKNRAEVAEDHCQNLLATGFSVLKNMKVVDARKIFNEELTFEKQTLGRDVVRYPEVYWGLLLADTGSASNENLATAKKRAAFPDTKLRSMPNFTAYLNAVESNGGKATEYNDLLKRRETESLRERGRKKVSVKRTGLVFLILLAICAVGAGIYGGLLFYSAGVSNAWYRALVDNLDIVLGVCIGAPAVIGAIIGFFLGVDTNAVAGAFGGAIAGGIVGGVITGVVFACCWALVPIGILLVLVGCGFGIAYYYKNVVELNQSEQEFLYGRIILHKHKSSSGALYKLVMCVIILVMLAAGVAGLLFIDELYNYLHFGVVIAVACVYLVVMIVLFVKLKARAACKVIYLLLFIASMVVLIGIMALPKWLPMSISKVDDFAKMNNCFYASFKLENDISFDGEGLPEMETFFGDFNGNGFKLTEFAQSGNWIKVNKGAIHDIEFSDAEIGNGLIDENEGSVERVKLLNINASFAGSSIDDFGILINTNTSEGVVNKIEGNFLSVELATGAIARYVGILIGQSNADVSELALLNSKFSNSNDTNFEAIGGLIGWENDNATLSNSFTDTLVFSLNSCSTASDSSLNCVGSLIGCQGGDVINCYANQIMYRGRFIGYIGGLVGRVTIDGASIRNSFFVMNSSYSSVTINNSNRTIAGISGLVSDGIEVCFDCIYQNVETKYYSYSDTTVNATNIYKSSSLSITNSSAVKSALQLDEKIWKITYSSVPQLQWYYDWVQQTANWGNVTGLS